MTSKAQPCGTHHFDEESCEWCDEYHAQEEGVDYMTMIGLDLDPVAVGLPPMKSHLSDLPF